MSATVKSTEVQHYFQPRRKTLGRSPLSNRKLYGWDAACRCGWQQKSNEGKRVAQQLFKAHLREVAGGRVHTPPVKQAAPQEAEPRPLPFVFKDLLAALDGVLDVAREYRREQESPVRDPILILQRRRQLFAVLDAATEKARVARRALLG